ncbi:MAG: hypothetical protein GC157_13790 [Frankiales bacterium]|nr:hypothetical protein [Frankiales bacterium]
MDEADEPQQFSEQTSGAINAAVDALVDALRSHAAFVGALRGGSSEMPSLFAANEAVERLITEWSERVFDHTGTFPAVLVGDPDLDGSDDDEDGWEELTEGDPLTVVSRWDLALVDPGALLDAGRAAHRRNRDEETDEDAAMAIATPANALYAILHESGEPWYRIPGVEVIKGARLFIRPDEQPAPLSADDEGDDVGQPAGEVLFGESWA